MDPETKRKIDELIIAMGAQSKSIDKLLKKMGGEVPKPGSKTDDKKDPGTKQKETVSIQTELNKKIKDTTNSNNQLTDSLGKMMTALDKVGKLGKTAYGSLEEFAELGNAKYDNIQRMFGGIPNDVRKAQTEGAARAVRDIDGIYATYLGNDRRFSDLQLKGARKGMNALHAFYEDEAKVADNYFAIRGELAQKQSTKFAEMSEQDVLKMSIMEKGFQISNQKVAELLDRQISLTGEASTRIFSEISAYSQKLAKNSKLSFQEISGRITDIITDVERFGNVQVEEAGRIAVALDQMGMSYEGFGGMVDKFMNFDSAAESLGNLTTVFGIHFDAMEMMQLANEDREEFLLRMRDAFLDSGKAVEDMTLAEKRLAAQQMGVSVRDFENFMQGDREVEDLTSVTDEVTEQDIGAGFQTMTDQMALVPHSAEDMKKQVVRKALDPMADRAYTTGKAFQAMKNEMALNPGKFLPGYVEFHTKLQQTMKATLTRRNEIYGVENKGLIDLIEAKATTEGTVLSDPKKFADLINRLKKKKGISSVDILKLASSTAGSPELSTFIMSEYTKRIKVGHDAAAEYLGRTENQDKINKGFVPDVDEVTKATKDFIKQWAPATKQGIKEAGGAAESPSPMFGVPIQQGIIDAFDIDSEQAGKLLSSGLNKVSNSVGSDLEADLGKVLGLPAEGVRSFLSTIDSPETQELLTQQLKNLNTHINQSANEMLSNKDSVVGSLMQGESRVEINSPNLVEKLQSTSDKAILAAETSQKASQEKSDSILKSLESFMGAVSKALGKEATVQNVLEIDGKVLAAQLMKIKVNDVGFKLTNAGGDQQ